MYSNQSPPLYTTRHYVLDPPSNSRNNYSSSNDLPRSSAQPYPYYTNYQQPTSITYMNGTPNYGQQSSSYVPPSPNRHTPTNNYNRNTGMGSANGRGGIEKTNFMSNDNPFYNPTRRYEQTNTPRTVTSITSPPKSGGGVNKTLNLSDENPFHSIYGGYHYPSQIDPSKRITTQNTTSNQMDNKSLNLSEENPFYSVYGRYHYPSQIDPSKRITEMPKSSGPLIPTNELSEGNPFSHYQPPSHRNYPNNNTGSNSYGTSNFDWNRNNDPAPLSYRPIELQRQPNYYDQRQASPVRQINPPSQPTPPPPPPPPQQSNPARFTNQKPNASAPLDKTSLNMSPDNPFAQTYGQYYYPSTEEIKAQKRAQQRSNRFNDDEPIKPNTNNDFNNRPVKPVKPANQMTEYPETENKEILSGKGNTKFARFDVNF